MLSRRDMRAQAKKKMYNKKSNFFKNIWRLWGESPRNTRGNGRWKTTGERIFSLWHTCKCSPPPFHSIIPSFAAICLKAGWREINKCFNGSSCFYCIVKRVHIISTNSFQYRFGLKFCKKLNNFSKILRFACKWFAVKNCWREIFSLKCSPRRCNYVCVDELWGRKKMEMS